MNAYKDMYPLFFKTFEIFFYIITYSDFILPVKYRLSTKKKNDVYYKV